MNILLINKYYKYKGGVEKHVFQLENLLKENGHNVIIFSTKDNQTVQNDYIKYFPKYFDISINSSFSEKISSISKFFINFEAIRKLKRLLKENHVDVAHIHNIYHHITPSILKVLKKHKIPIVMTIHDYKLICPNYSLFDFNKAQICEKCKNGNYFNCFQNKCIQNSGLKSLVATCEMYFQKMFFPYEKLVDIFIAPSEFIKNKFFEFGFKNKNIQVIPNFTQSIESSENNINNYFLFFGRLSKEKGLDKFIKILSKIKQDFEFYIIGSGPQEKELKSLVENLNLSKKIKFLGFFDKNKQSELDKFIKEARFVVIPSIWYENCSLSIIESMSKSKVVFATNTGGNKELIKDEKTGFLFDINDEKNTIEKLVRLLEDDNLIKTISYNAKLESENKFNKDIYYQKLISIYESLINKS